MHKVSKANRPESVSSFEGRDTRDDGTGSAWDLPFRIQWVRTDSLLFLHTRHLRNPWNHDHEVKVSRDGTKLEPTVGQQLLDEWDRLSVPVNNSLGPSRTRQRRRRGSKSTKRSKSFVVGIFHGGQRITGHRHIMKLQIRSEGVPRGVLIYFFNLYT